MTRVSRVVPALAVLLAMIGLPLAAVVCDLACASIEARSTSGARIGPVDVDGPCHETSPAVRADAPASADPAVDSVPGHACEHPIVVSTRRAAEGVRVPAPMMSPVLAAWHPAARLAPQASRAASGSERPPVPSVAAGAFSPILRI